MGVDVTVFGSCVGNTSGGDDVYSSKGYKSISSSNGFIRGVQECIYFSSLSILSLIMVIPFLFSSATISNVDTFADMACRGLRLSP